MDTIPFPTENFIEDYVAKKMEADKRCPITDDYLDFFLRQYALGAYGVADIIKVEVSPWAIDITVLELKKEVLKESHISQLARYMRGVEIALEPYKNRLPPGWELSVKGQLAGPVDYDRGDFIFALHLLDERVSVWDLSLSMDDGFFSKEVGHKWRLRDGTHDIPKSLVRSVFGSIKFFERGLARRGNVVPLGEKNG